MRPHLVISDFIAPLCWVTWPQQLVAYNISPFLQSRKLGLKSPRDLPENMQLCCA